MLGRKLFKIPKIRSSKCKATNRSPKYIQKYIFKCDQRGEIISEKLLSFYKEDEFFDTVLKAGSDCVSIQAHRVVLCSLSEYFLERFRGGQSTLKDNVVVLEEIEGSTLKLIIDFLYSGSIELSLETVGGILQTAVFLKIKTLVDGCCEFIEKNINSSNSLNWLRLANELSLPALKTKILDYTYNHFEEISQGKELLMLSENELKDLLFNDNFHTDSEEAVFLAMVAWINHDKLNRGCLDFQLLSMVRYRALTPKFIVENRKSVCKTVESYELICSWLQWHLSPETRSNDEPDKLAVIRVFDDQQICVETLDPKTNAWTIEKETSFHTITWLSSIIEIERKLIVVRGIGDYHATESVECLDLDTFKSHYYPPMKKNRACCQLVALKGYLCVFGGEIGEDSYSLEIYNFSTGKWNDLQPLHEPYKRSKITSYNGLIYIIDFDNGYLQSYDVTSDKWTSKVVEKTKLGVFGFVANKGFLYIIGGYNDKLGFTKTVTRYNLSTDSWCEMAPLPHICYDIKTTVFENKIIIVESVNVAEYSPETNTWNLLSPLTNYRPCILKTLCNQT